MTDWTLLYPMGVDVLGVQLPDDGLVMQAELEGRDPLRMFFSLEDAAVLRNLLDALLA